MTATPAGPSGQFVEQTIKCKDCGNEFVLTVAEQEWYERKGMKNLPKRCKGCLKAKKDRQQPVGKGGR